MDNKLLHNYNIHKDDLIYLKYNWNKTSIKKMSDDDIKNEINYYNNLNLDFCDTYLVILYDVINRRRKIKINKILNVK